MPSSTVCRSVLNTIRLTHLLLFGVVCHASTNVFTRNRSRLGLICSNAHADSAPYITRMTDTTSFDYNTPFTPSRSKKKRRNRTGVAPVTPQVALDRTRQELSLGEWMQDCKRRWHAFRYCRGILTTELRLSGLVRESISSLFSHPTNPPRILCLGLGSPSSARDARSQLAFLLELCDAISIVCPFSLYRRSLVMASAFMCS